jgi:DNA-binding MarR family transcriptional regulator
VQQPRNARSGPADVSFAPERSVGYLVRETHRAFARALERRIRPHGVTMGMWFFFRALWEEDGINQRELSRRVGMMEPTTVTALRAMERRGYVRRVRSAKDRRSIHVHLTPLGRRLKRRLLPYAVEVNAEALSGVSGRQLRTIRELLGRMRNSLAGFNAGA